MARQYRPKSPPKGLTCDGLTLRLSGKPSGRSTPQGNTPRLEGLYMSNGNYCTCNRGRRLSQDHLFIRPPRCDGVLTGHHQQARTPFLLVQQRQPPSAAIPTQLNGMTRGPSPPICSRWLLAIWSHIPEASHKIRAAPRSDLYGTSAVTRAMRLLAAGAQGQYEVGRKTSTGPVNTILICSNIGWQVDDFNMGAMGE